MKHIVFCTRHFSRDGGSTGQYVHETVLGLLERNPELTISVLTSNETYRGEEYGSEGEGLAGRLRLRRLRLPRLKGTGLMARLVNDALFTAAVFVGLITGRRPDLVVVYTSPFLLPAGTRLAHLVRGFPYAYVLHDIYPEVLVATQVARDRDLFVRLLRYCQRRWLEASAAIVVLGRCMARTLMTNYSVEARRLHVIPHWPNPEHSEPIVGFDPPSSIVTIIYGGNLGYAQDLETVLAAASLAQARGVEVRFSFLVSGNHVAHWREAAEERGLRSVDFRSAVPSREYSALVASADIGLVVLREGFAGLAVPSKLYNLLAAGKPILAVMEAASETAMVIEEHRCGFRVDPGDDYGLQAALAMLVEDPRLRCEMGQRARRAAQRTYPFGLAVERFQHMIEEVRREAIGTQTTRDDANRFTSPASAANPLDRPDLTGRRRQT